MYLEGENVCRQEYMKFRNIIKITTLMKHINADEAKTFVHHNHQIHVNPNTTRDDFSLLSVVFV